MNSIVYAAAATLIAVVVGGLAAFAVAGLARVELLDALVMLPLGASAVMLGLRLPDRVRHAAARLPRGAVARPGRPGARRDPLRRADRRADAALDRPAPARSRGAARCLARPRAPRDRPADRLARARRRRRLRVRDLARRVRRDGVPRAARPADAARRDLPLPRAARARSTSRRPTRSRSCSWSSPSSRCSSSSGCACAAAGWF